MLNLHGFFMPQILEIEIYGIKHTHTYILYRYIYISTRVGMVPATHQLIANLEDVVNFLLGGGFNPFEKY